MDEKPKPVPEWRRRREAQAPVYAEWWRRRHHCSDGVVLGERHQSKDAAAEQTTPRDRPTEPT